MGRLERFLAELTPLLERQGARAAYLFGSHARGEADEHSDADLIVVAPTERTFVERFRNYLPAIAGAGVGVDLLVYTPEELERLVAEDRAFVVDALAEARVVYEGEDEQVLLGPPPGQGPRVTPPSSGGKR